MFDGIKLLQSEIWSSPLLLLLFLMAAGYLIVRAKRQKLEQLTFLLVYSGLTCVLYLLNPVLSYGIIRVTGDPYAFVRFAWIVPAFPLMAYAGEQLVMGLQGKRRAIAVAVIVAVIVSSGSYLTKINVRTSNPYKIMQDAKDCSDLILAREGITDPLGGGYIPVNVQLHDTRISEDGTESNVFYYGIRQYAKSFVLSRTTLTQSEYENPEFSYEGYFSNQCRYYICDKNENITRELAKIGYEPLGETEYHAVYENTFSYNLFLVRHGQTEANVNGQLVGHTESSLTEVGQETTKELGAALKGVTFEKAYASYLERAVVTAQNVLDASGNATVEVEVNPYLADLNYGEAEGMTWEQIQATYGSGMDFRRLFGPAEDADYVPQIPGADTLFTYIQGVSSGMNMVATEAAIHHQNNANILVANHSGIRYWLEQQLPGGAVPAGLDNASLTILRYDRGVWNAIVINDTDYEHLPDVLASMEGIEEE